jgi:hypothetical protein
LKKRLSSPPHHAAGRRELWGTNASGRPSSCAAKSCMTFVPLPYTRGNCGNPPLHYS